MFLMQVGPGPCLEDRLTAQFPSRAPQLNFTLGRKPTLREHSEIDFHPPVTAVF